MFIPFSVYCPYPGTVPQGRVLLVGNMGMYDYRPYVRKVNLKLIFIAIYLLKNWSGCIFIAL